MEIPPLRHPILRSPGPKGEVRRVRDSLLGEGDTLKGYPTFSGLGEGDTLKGYPTFSGLGERDTLKGYPTSFGVVHACPIINSHGPDFLSYSCCLPCVFGGAS
jgi:hypothetical protein